LGEKNMLPDLDTLLNYKHTKVIQSYIRNYSVDESKASELFKDMLRYLWLSRKHAFDQEQQPKNKDLQFQFVMHEEMRDIDNMWHNFILYTRDYTSFCVQTFGEYLHHVPDIAETIIQTNEEFALELHKYLSYVYDHLGEETIKRWFSSYI
jgi:hypothetical protein